MTRRPGEGETRGKKRRLRVPASPCLRVYSFGIPHSDGWSCRVDLHCLIVLQGFRLHPLPAADVQKGIVDLLAYFINGCLSRENPAGIEIDVVLHDPDLGGVSG